MRIVPGFIIREIADEIVAVPTGDAAHRLSGLAALNGSGKYLFELLQTEQTEETLVDQLMEVYDIDRTTAQTDVAEFLQKLQENGMLV